MKEVNDKQEQTLDSMWKFLPSLLHFGSGNEGKGIHASYPITFQIHSILITFGLSSLCNIWIREDTAKIRSWGLFSISKNLR